MFGVKGTALKRVFCLYNQRGGQSRSKESKGESRDWSERQRWASVTHGSIPSLNAKQKASQGLAGAAHAQERRTLVCPEIGCTDRRRERWDEPGRPLRAEGTQVGAGKGSRGRTTGRDRMGYMCAGRLSMALLESRTAGYYRGAGAGAEHMGGRI